jgi:excisionase family DNA binding protein
VAQENATAREIFGKKKEVAARYQVCVRTVDYWIAAKRIPVIRVGGLVRFHMQRVDEALRRFEVKEIAK